MKASKTDQDRTMPVALRTNKLLIISSPFGWNQRTKIHNTEKTREFSCGKYITFDLVPAKLHNCPQKRSLFIHGARINAKCLAYPHRAPSFVNVPMQTKQR